MLRVVLVGLKAFLVSAAVLAGGNKAPGLARMLHERFGVGIGWS